jgi:spore coat protein U-like protein
MKKLAFALAALALCGAANAATATGPFAVTVNFTSACQATTPAPTLAFGAYTAFGAAATASATIAFECSRGTSATAVSVSNGAANGLFTTANLQYTLTLPATPIASSGGTAATAAAIGTADTLSITVNGTLPQQAGASNSGTATTDTDNRTITITF